MRDTGPWKCSLVTEENELAESTFDVTVFTPAEVDFGARPFRFVMIIRYHTVFATKSYVSSSLRYCNFDAIHLRDHATSQRLFSSTPSDR